jgi:SAM-dependent methyltransferase
MNLFGRLHGSLVFNRRTRILAAHLAEMLPPIARVLDVGCGDGTIGRLVGELRPDVAMTGIDVMIRPTARILVRQFNGKTIPYDDNSFDVVMFVDVLHHTDDPEILVREARRVARQAVVLKDHTRDGILAGPILRFMDWFGNAPHGVVLPYNYWPEQRWHQAFAHIGLRPQVWLAKLGLYPIPASWIFDRSLHFIARLDPV